MPENFTLSLTWLVFMKFSCEKNCYFYLGACFASKFMTLEFFISCFRKVLQERQSFAFQKNEEKKDFSSHIQFRD